MPGLSFRVRDGAGRFPWAMTATRLYFLLLFCCFIVWWVGDRLVDGAAACLRLGGVVHSLRVCH